MDPNVVVVKVSHPKMVYYADFTGKDAMKDAVQFAAQVGRNWSMLDVEVVELTDPCPASLHFDRLAELIELVNG